MNENNTDEQHMFRGLKASDTIPFPQRMECDGCGQLLGYSNGWVQHDIYCVGCYEKKVN